MWRFRYERYTATTTIIKATVHTMLAPMKDTGQPMHKDVAKWKSRALQLASMDATLDKGILVAMVTK